MMIRVVVRARARLERVVDRPDGSVKVWVTVPPVDGKANEDVLKILARHFHVKRSEISLIRGHASSNKWVEVEKK